MTHRISTLLLAVVLGGLAVFIGALHAVLSPASPSHALSGDGHGPGYLSQSGWWLGTYRLDDGVRGFCLDAGKLSPRGRDYDYVDAASLGRYTPEETARLAYISRTWAGTEDRLTAAAGQLATWMVTGSGGASLESLAARAGADAAAVLSRAEEMSQEAARAASTAVRASVGAELSENGPGRVRVELTVDRLSGPEVLPPGTHSATVSLVGAAFADGSTTAEVTNATDVPVHVTGTGADVSVRAEAAFADLPYGDRLLVAAPRDPAAQAVLVAQPASASASGSADAFGPSPLPFQPTVQTVTSAASAAPGATIHDELTVGVAEADGRLSSWGVRLSESGLEPIRVVVESTLHGPFDSPITLAEEAPPGSPVVCTVETLVDGPGSYRTPPCTLAAEGHYVWTERIDPGRLSPSDGGLRVLPWKSQFGVASETTVVTAPQAPSTPPVTPMPSELAATGDTKALALGAAGASAGLAVIGGGVMAARGRRLRARHRGPRRVRSA